MVLAVYSLSFRAGDVRRGIYVPLTCSGEDCMLSFRAGGMRRGIYVLLTCSGVGCVLSFRAGGMSEERDLCTSDLQWCWLCTQF